MLFVVLNNFSEYKGVIRSKSWRIIVLGWPAWAFQWRYPNIRMCRFFSRVGCFPHSEELSTLLLRNFQDFSVHSKQNFSAKPTKSYFKTYKILCHSPIHSLCVGHINLHSGSLMDQVPTCLRVFVPYGNGSTMMPCKLTHLHIVHVGKAGTSAESKSWQNVCDPSWIQGRLVRSCCKGISHSFPYLPGDLPWDSFS